MFFFIFCIELDFELTASYNINFAVSDIVINRKHEHNWVDPHQSILHNPIGTQKSRFITHNDNAPRI